MSPFRSDRRVLIVAPDPLLAALIGVLVDAARLLAVFPAPEERIEDALRRTRPLAAVLVDALAGDAASDVFLARAQRGNVPVLLFGAEADVARVRVWAAERDVPVFVLPRDTRELSASLTRLAHRRHRAGGDRRDNGAARTERSRGGNIVLQDGRGGRWTIYDRRTGDRRGVEREFVSDDGEVRRCTLSLAEARSDDAEELSRQLAAASIARSRSWESGE